MPTRNIGTCVVAVAAVALGSLTPGSAVSGRAQPGALAATPAQTRAGGPCLEGDPLGLETLERRLLDERPPTAPAAIGASITLEYVGEGTMTDEAPEMPQEEAREVAEPEEPAEPGRSEDAVFHVFVPATLNQYRVSVAGPALQQIRDCYEKTGHGLPPFPPDYRGGEPAAAASIVPAAWSNGKDGRVVMNPNDSYPRETIAAFASSNKQDAGCSGTLVGPRHVITAAHCIQKVGTSTFYGVELTPSRHGITDTVDLISFSGGTAGVMYWTFPGWKNPQPSNRGQWDTGLIVIPKRLGDTYSWMHVAVRGMSGLKNQGSYNRGYPNCLGDGKTRGNAPKPCEQMKLYGDQSTCDAAWFQDKGSDGYHRNFWMNCDISAGHSGSPYYQFLGPDGNTPTVVGVVVAESTCYTCSLVNEYVNRVRRVTPDLVDQYWFMRELHP